MMRLFRLEDFRFQLKKPAKRTMTALPTSLRRTLLVLLCFGVSIFIMVFYWNQNPPRPTAMVNTVLTAASKAIKVAQPL